MRCARALALASAGRSIAARMAMMAITTSNSISVKPWLFPLDNCRAGFIASSTQLASFSGRSQISFLAEVEEQAGHNQRRSLLKRFWAFADFRNCICARPASNPPVLFPHCRDHSRRWVRRARSRGAAPWPPPRESRVRQRQAVAELDWWTVVPAFVQPRLRWPFQPRVATFCSRSAATRPWPHKAEELGYIDALYFLSGYNRRVTRACHQNNGQEATSLRGLDEEEPLEISQWAEQGITD